MRPMGEWLIIHLLNTDRWKIGSWLICVYFQLLINNGWPINLLVKEYGRMTHCRPLFLNSPRIISKLTFCCTLTSLAGPLYDCSDWCRGNGVHQWQQHHTGWTEAFWGSGGVRYWEHITGPHLAGISAQKAELAALKMAWEMRKDKTQLAGVPLLAFISMGPFIRRGAFWWGRTKLHPREQQDSPVGDPRNWTPHDLDCHRPRRPHTLWWQRRFDLGQKFIDLSVERDERGQLTDY